jgi:hypothetical protein
MTMFTGSEGEEISLTTAASWTANFRSEYPGAIKAYTFGRTILLDILGQTSCVGIRIYYALDGEGVQKLILVGVNADGDDLTSGIVADRGEPCPTFCDSGNSSLNK